MFEFLGFCIAGYLCIRVLRRRGVRQASEATEEWKRATERVLLLEKQLKETVAATNRYRELEQQLLSDAIAREDRAIRVVEAVLHANQVSEEWIGQIVDQIKGGGA